MCSPPGGQLGHLIVGPGMVPDGEGVDVLRAVADHELAPTGAEADA